MAARKGILFALLLSSTLLLLVGCIAPQPESPLITTSKDYIMGQGKSERFRLLQNGSTPEYVLEVKSVQNVTVLFLLQPGNRPIALAKGRSSGADLDGDGSADVVLSLSKIENGEAHVTLYAADAAPLCATSCPPGQLQNPFPSCSCYSVNRTCADGTLFGQCSATKPKFCQNGTLVDKCSSCGCSGALLCNSTSNACYSPSATPTPAPSPSATVTPTPLDESMEAIAVANQTTEGQLMGRFAAAYTKSQQCTEDQFSSAFTSRLGRPPNQRELSLFTSTKNFLPTGVSAAATRNGSQYDVVYRTTGGSVPGDALKVVVISGQAIIATWQGQFAIANCGAGKTITECYDELLDKVEAISGNCGLILVLNAWA